MNDYFKHLNLPIDFQKCTDEFNLVEDECMPYENKETFAKDTFFAYAPEWEIVTLNDKNTPYIHSLSKMFSEEYSLGRMTPRFRRQLAGTAIPKHVDRVITCAINILISEDSGPITFTDIGDVDYSVLLLNTTKLHSVKAHTTDRIILKFPIFEIPFREVVAKFQ